MDFRPATDRQMLGIYGGSMNGAVPNLGADRMRAFSEHLRDTNNRASWSADPFLIGLAAIGQRRFLRERRATSSVVQRTMTDAHDQVRRIEAHDDLAAMLPSELALAADPRTRDLFALNRLRGDTLGITRSGIQQARVNPLVIIVDVSDSMVNTFGTITSGDRELRMSRLIWALGTALTLVNVGRFVGRPTYLVPFAASCGTMRIAPRLDALDCARVICRSCVPEVLATDDTQYQPVLREIMSRCESEQWGHADCVWITDGQPGDIWSSYWPARTRAWNMFRAEHKIRVTGVFLGMADDLVPNTILAGLVDQVIAMNTLVDERALIGVLARLR